MHASNEAPSAWLVKFAHLIPSGGEVLDLACGNGRSARWLARQGWSVLAVDRDTDALAGLHGQAGIRVLQADLETGCWPLAGRRFAAIVVCRYLHRPLLPLLAASLAEGGVLIYETFMQGQERLGRPRNPDFLLRPGELRLAYTGILDIVAFEQGEFAEPQAALLQRLCARKLTEPNGKP